MKELTDEQTRALIFGVIALRDLSEDQSRKTTTDQCDPHFWSRSSAESFEDTKILAALACPLTWRDNWMLRTYRWHALTPFSPTFAAAQHVRAYRERHPQVANWFFEPRFAGEEKPCTI